MNPDLAAAIVAESHRTPEAALDLLLEMNATLCDVLLLYAGTPPEWEDGLAQEVLSGWLARTGDKRSEWMPLYRVIRGDIWTTAHPADPLNSDDRAGQIVQAWPAEADALRYLKRRVLSLFPEVEYTREVAIPDSLLAGLDQNGNIVLKGKERASFVYRDEWLELRGIRQGFIRSETRGLIRTEDGKQEQGNAIVQTLSAPDWISPSYEEERRSHYGRSPLAAAYGPWRTMMEARRVFAETFAQSVEDAIRATAPDRPT